MTGGQLIDRSILWMVDVQQDLVSRCIRIVRDGAQGEGQIEVVQNRKRGCQDWIEKKTDTMKWQNARRTGKGSQQEADRIPSQLFSV
jgi:hypothetical protein